MTSSLETPSTPAEIAHSVATTREQHGLELQNLRETERSNRSNAATDLLLEQITALREVFEQKLRIRADSGLPRNRAQQEADRTWFMEGARMALGDTVLDLNLIESGQY